MRVLTAKAATFLGVFVVLERAFEQSVDGVYSCLSAEKMLVQQQESAQRPSLHRPACAAARTPVRGDVPISPGRPR